jgi:hypothetical protein
VDSGREVAPAERAARVERLAPADSRPGDTGVGEASRGAPARVSAVGGAGTDAGAGAEGSTAAVGRGGADGVPAGG